MGSKEQRYLGESIQMEIELSSKDDTKRVCALEGCEKEFKPKRRWQRFCCAAHTQRYHTLMTRKGRELMNASFDQSGNKLITRDQS